MHGNRRSVYPSHRDNKKQFALQGIHCMCDVIDFMSVRLTHNTPLQFESITRDFLTRWSLAKFKLLTITNLPPGNLHQL